MRGCSIDWPGLFLFCFCNRVDFGLVCFINFLILHIIPHPQVLRIARTKCDTVSGAFTAIFRRLQVHRILVAAVWNFFADDDSDWDKS